MGAFTYLAIAIAIVGVAAAGLVFFGGPPMSAEARQALADADIQGAANEAARQAMRDYPTDVAPYLPGPPSEYRPALAAGRDSLLASEQYESDLRAAAADGKITEQEQAALNTSRLRAEAAADAEYQAWIDTPVGDLVAIQSEMWEHVGNAMAAERP